MTTPPAGRPGSPAWRPWRTPLRLAVGAAIGATALYVVSSSAGGFGDALEALRHANPLWLPAALAVEVVCYVVIGLELRILSRPVRPRLTVALRAGLVNSGLGSLLPGSPAPGIALTITQLRHHGVPAGNAAVAVGWMS